ncbi:MAG: hypothetical protein NTX65_11875 [Ignavibacteriales bacterium]|nr:hypothetical protein [Ignavibacteriales bacterium]
MNQDLAVFAIIGLTASLTVFSFIKNLLTKKTKNGCGGCTGCELSKFDAGCKH